VSYHDPYVSALPAFGLEHADLPDASDGIDLAVIVTAHPDVDHWVVAGTAPATVDLRGVTRGLTREGVLRL
jgi:UDP-N-acetyl-D-glucosamine dehydrogenase